MRVFVGIVHFTYETKTFYDYNLEVVNGGILCMPVVDNDVQEKGERSLFG